jgi:hypothetical protein
MAKQPKYKRTIGKDGTPYYFELKKDNRGVTRYVPTKSDKARLNFIQKNFDNVRKPSQQKNLSDQEKETLKRVKQSKELYKIKGKAIKRWKTDYLEFAKIIDPKKMLNRDLDKLPIPFSTPSSVDRLVNNLLDSQDFVTMATEIGAGGFRDRNTAVGIHDIVEKLDFLGTDGWKLEIETLGGSTLRGTKALEYLKEYEINTTNDLADKTPNVAAVRFNYKLKYDRKTKVVYIVVADTDPVPMQSDPIKRTK